MTLCRILDNLTGFLLWELQALERALDPIPTLARALDRARALDQARARALDQARALDPIPALVEKYLTRHVQRLHLPTLGGLALRLLPLQTSRRDSLEHRIPCILIQGRLEFHTVL